MLDNITLQSLSLFIYDLYLTSFHKGSKMAYQKLKHNRKQENLKI